MILVLKDTCDCSVDAVVVTKTSTQEDVQNAIDEVKSTIECLDFYDIERALPRDCKVYKNWESGFKTVWY